MFVPHARVRLVGLREHTERRRRRVPRRRLDFVEILRMPCLFPTLAATLFGILVMGGGCVMSVLGFNSQMASETVFNQNKTEIPIQNDGTYYALKVMSYLGPMLMGIGLFVIIVAAVLHCEIMDKYVNIVPVKNSKAIGRNQLYKLIIEQFRKNYFRGIEVPLQKPHHVLRSGSMNKTLFKALSISTPAMLATPELTSPWKTRHKSPSPDVKVKKSVRLKLIEWEERWLKTSSLPNIRPTDNDSTDVDSTDTGLTSRDEYLKTKRMSKSCGNVPQMYTSVGEFSDMTSSGLDNPAYMPDAEKDKLLKPMTISENYQSCDLIKDSINVQCVPVIVHKASIHTPPQINDMQMGGIRHIKSFDQDAFTHSKILEVKPTDKCKSCHCLVDVDGRFCSPTPRQDSLNPRTDDLAHSTDSIMLAEDMLRIFDMAEMAQV